MRKIVVISLFFFSVALLALFFWPDSLLTKITRWQVERRCLALFGQPLRASRVEESGRTLTFYQPLFYEGVSSEGGGAVVAASKLEVTLHCQPLKGRLLLDLHLTSPRLQIVKNGEELPQLGWNLRSKGPLLSPQIEWLVKGGTIELYDLPHGRSTLLPIEMISQIWPGKANRFQITSGLIEAAYDADRSGALLTFSHPSGDCTPLASALHFFYGQRCNGLEIYSGELVGSGHLWLPAEGAPHLEGSICLSELKMKNRSIGLEGSIPKIEWTIEADPKWAGRKSLPTLRSIAERSLSHLLLSEGGFLSVASDKIPHWRFDLEEGKAEIRWDQLVASLDGVVTSNEWSSLLRTEGEIRFGSEPNATLEMAWPMRTAALTAPHTHLSWKGRDLDKDQIELELVQIGPEEAIFLRSIAACLYPNAAELSIEEGRISARLGVDFERWHPRHLQVDHFEVEEFRFAYPPHGTAGAIASARGRLETKITPSNPINQLTGWISVREANVTLASGDQLQELKGEIRLLRGALESASLTARFRDMESSLLFHPFAAEPEIHLSLEGKGGQLAPYLPLAYRAPFARQFDQELVTLRTSIAPSAGALSLEGSCTIAPKELKRELLTFGADFDLHSQNKGATLLPPWLLALISQKKEHDFSWTRGRVQGISLAKGWFHGEELPLHRYAPVLALLAPYISVEGSVEIAGLFDSKQVEVEYEAHNVLFHTPLFEVAASQLGNLHNAKNSAEDRATHSVEIASGEQRGFIPVKNGSCWIKQGDLHFSEVNGHLSVSNQRVDVEELSAFADGLFFAGALHLDRSNPSQSQLHIAAPVAVGTSANVQKLCRRYSDLSLWELPIDGEVIAREEGLHLYLSFYSDRPTELDLSLSGSLSKGHWASPSGGMAISNTDLAFDYDHKPEQLRLRHLHGELTLADGSHYSLGGRGVDLCDVRHALGRFDLSLSSAEGVTARFAGSCLPLNASDPQSLWTLELNPALTQIGNLFPRVDRCLLDGWKRVVAFEASPSFDLATLSSDSRLLSSNLSQLKQLFGSNGRGTLHGQIAFDDAFCRVALAGEALELFNQPIDQFDLAAERRDGIWWIDRLNAGPLQATARIATDETGWSLDQVALQVGSELHLLMNGRYSPASGQIEASIAEGWLRVSKTSPLFAQTQFSGQLTGSGLLSLQFTKGDSPKLDRFALELLPEGFSVRGAPITAKTPLSIYGGEGKALLFGPSRIHLSSPEKPSETVELWWDRMVYDRQNSSLTALPLHFALSTGNLSWFSPLLEIGPRVEAFLANLSPNGSLRGEIDLKTSGKALRLESGSYCLNGSLYPLVDPRVDLSTDLIEVAAQFEIGHRPLQLHLRTSPNDYQKGCAFIYEEGAVGRPLALDWHWSEGAGLQFDSIEGELSGLNVNLISFDPSRETPPKRPRATPRKPPTRLALATGKAEGSGVARSPLAQGEAQGSGMERALLAQGRADGVGEARAFSEERNEIATLLSPIASGGSSGSGAVRKSVQASGGSSGSGTARGQIAQGEASGRGKERSFIASGGASGSGDAKQFHLAPAMLAEGGSPKLFWGRVEVDGRKAQGLFPPEFAALLSKLGVGAGYELEGLFCLDDKWHPLAFEGVLHGEGAELAHLKFDQLSANLIASRSEISLSNFRVADSAGALFLPQVRLWNQEGDGWHFASPTLHLSGINPLQLKIDKELPKSLRTIAVPKAELSDLQGRIGDRTSWSAKGFLQIDSTLARVTPPGIFAIPADLLSRLGLESGNLTPATGRINLQIADGRCYITHFDNLYSRSHNSQFFLAKDQGRSYIDFDGNIEVALRMKQYNLLLKFTEMFLVSVRGTVGSPHCSLQEDLARHQQRLEASPTFPFTMQ